MTEIRNIHVWKYHSKKTPVFYNEYMLILKNQHGLECELEATVQLSHEADEQRTFAWV